MVACLRRGSWVVGCLVLMLAGSRPGQSDDKPAPQPAPVRVLLTDLASHSAGVEARLKKLNFDIVVVAWSKFDPAPAKGIDVIFLPTYWAGEDKTYQFFESKKEAVHRFVERGGGLVVCQPNANACTPALLPYPITFQNQYDAQAPARVNLAHDHFITEDLPDEAMPFPADPIVKIDPRYRVLAKQKSTGWPSLAVCAFGDGRVVVQTANESYAATIPIGDEILRRMIVWAAGRERMPGAGRAVMDILTGRASAQTASAPPGVRRRCPAASRP